MAECIWCIEALVGVILKGVSVVLPGKATDVEAKGQTFDPRETYPLKETENEYNRLSPPSSYTTQTSEPFLHLGKNTSKKHDVDQATGDQAIKLLLPRPSGSLHESKDNLMEEDPEREQKSAEASLARIQIRHRRSIRTRKTSTKVPALHEVSRKLCYEHTNSPLNNRPDPSASTYSESSRKSLYELDMELSLPRYESQKGSKPANQSKRCWRKRNNKSEAHLSTQVHHARESPHGYNQSTSANVHRRQARDNTSTPSPIPPSKLQSPNIASYYTSLGGINLSYEPQGTTEEEVERVLLRPFLQVHDGNPGNRSECDLRDSSSAAATIRHGASSDPKRVNEKTEAAVQLTLQPIYMEYEKIKADQPEERAKAMWRTKTFGREPSRRPQANERVYPSPSLSPLPMPKPREKHARGRTTRLPDTPKLVHASSSPTSKMDEAQGVHENKRPPMTSSSTYSEPSTNDRYEYPSSQTARPSHKTSDTRRCLSPVPCTHRRHEGKNPTQLGSRQLEPNIQDTQLEGAQREQPLQRVSQFPQQLVQARRHQTRDNRGVQFDVRTSKTSRRENEPPFKQSQNEEISRETIHTSPASQWHHRKSVRGAQKYQHK
ncbi:hypothetical protein BJ508DRAFT_310671 [Ascobolus immersus RN42]|uniref:Uncharacterized protein n=1 Tax=Ascobolus immersus RN42 TaxID=1160509 RepID=A0A3N4HSW6_ASCIM|nr:hypothetical protein BJ508DRAFT_310671 [Ascobolus immersus RN42]